MVITFSDPPKGGSYADFDDGFCSGGDASAASGGED